MIRNTLHGHSRALFLGAVTEDLPHRLVQFGSVAQSCLTLCDPMDCSTPGPLSITNSWSLPKLVSVELVMPSTHLILCHSLLLPPSVFPSIRVFSNELTLHIRWPKNWSFINGPFSEYSGLISFRTDWFDLLVVQRTLKSLLQDNNFSFKSVEVIIMNRIV